MGVKPTYFQETYTLTENKDGYTAYRRWASLSDMLAGENDGRLEFERKTLSVDIGWDVDVRVELDEFGYDVNVKEE